MKFLKIRYLLFFFALTVLIFFNSLPLFSEEQPGREIKINLVNFSEEDYLESFTPLLPLSGYKFSRYYTFSDKPADPAKGAIGFYIGKNIIEGREYYRISANAVDKTGKAFLLEWDISDGWFLDNRKDEALKFSIDTIFDSEKTDVNSAFSDRLLKTKSISELKPLYPDGDLVSEIDGYEFNYKLHRSSTYRALRTSGEILLFCGIGIANYYATRKENEVDWVYEYKWEDVDRKIEDGWYWDPNNFNTNSIYHLYAGMIYYQTARSNYYTVPESFLWSFGGSLLWEYIGEWREQVSANDMIFTPIVGSITGEAFIQTTRFIEKKMDPGVLRDIITFILDPVGLINRKIDTANSGDIRVRLLFVNPVQAAANDRIEKEILNR